MPAFAFRQAIGGSTLRGGDTLRATAAAISVNLGQALNTETATALSAVHQVVLGQAIETGTGAVLTPVEMVVVAVDQAIETDVGTATSLAHRVPLPQAGGTGEGFGEGEFGEGGFGGGVSDLANAFTPQHAITVGQAVEIDSGAEPLVPTDIIVIAQVLEETDTADVLAITRIVPLNRAFGLDQPDELSPGSARAITQTVSIETANTLEQFGAVAIGQALETDLALGFTIEGIFKPFRLVGGDRAPTVSGFSMRISGGDRLRQR